MNSKNKQVQENTIQSQNEWNACLLFRNKQLTKEVKELRSVSAAMDCSASQLQALSQLLRLHTTPAYGRISLPCLICFTGVASWQTWESVSLPLRN